MPAITLYLGLDVHKDSITLAITHRGPHREICLFGTSPTTSTVGAEEEGELKK